MFSLDVVDSDKFTDMPSGSQALYFHLGMRADDDGFVSSPKKIMRSLNFCDDEMKILIAKGFIHVFESGICVVLHWKMNNSIKNDRYKKTIHCDEISQLSTDNNGAYVVDNQHCIQNGSKLDPKKIQTGSKMDPQYRLEENSIEEISIVISSENSDSPTKTKRFVIPTVEEVKEYCDQRKNNVNANKFHDHYSANGWMVGKNKMKDWKSAVRTWENSDFSSSNNKAVQQSFFQIGAQFK